MSPCEPHKGTYAQISTDQAFCYQSDACQARTSTRQIRSESKFETRTKSRTPVFVQMIRLQRSSLHSTTSRPKKRLQPSHRSGPGSSKEESNKQKLSLIILFRTLPIIRSGRAAQNAISKASMDITTFGQHQSVDADAKGRMLTLQEQSDTRLCSTSNK